MSDAQHFRRPAASTLLIALCIAAIVATVTLPTALRGGFLTPDATEHLSIAHNWLEGAGFVDPVQWYYLLDQPPPIPATAARAPVVSLLAAIPLRMGGHRDNGHRFACGLGGCGGSPGVLDRQ